MRGKWIPAGLVVGLLAAAITGGAVLASGGGDGGNGGTGAEEVVVKDGDVSVLSIENTEVESGEPDDLAVRVAEILGADTQATYDAMVQADVAAEPNPGRSGEGNESDQDADSMSVEAEGRSYLEYGNRIGAILGKEAEAFPLLSDGEVVGSITASSDLGPESGTEQFAVSAPDVSRMSRFLDRYLLWAESASRSWVRRWCGFSHGARWPRRRGWEPRPGGWAGATCPNAPRSHALPKSGSWPTASTPSGRGRELPPKPQRRHSPRTADPYFQHPRLFVGHQGRGVPAHAGNSGHHPRAVIPAVAACRGPASSRAG